MVCRSLNHVGQLSTGRTFSGCGAAAGTFSHSRVNHVAFTACPLYTVENAYTHNSNGLSLLRMNMHGRALNMQIGNSFA